MIQIEFDYNQQITVIQAKLDEPFKVAIDKYLQKVLFDPNNVFFIANGRQINPEDKIENQISQSNKENKKLKILVQLIERTTIIEQFAKSKDIICPECKEPCRIKTDNFKISLFGCIKNHTKTLKIKDFIDSQKINISNIKCEKCKIKNKGNCPNNEFYKCLTCNTNICLLCKPIHQSNHNLINYDHKNYICEKHNEHFIKYCLQCNKNICYSCDDEHEEHNQMYLNDIKININEKKNNLNIMKKEIDIFNNNINEIINKLKDISNIMNLYYEINNNIINNYEKKNRNYQILQNIKQINNNNEIYQTLNKINKMNNIKDQLYNIIDLYNNINSDNIEIKNESINDNKKIKNESIKENKEILNNNSNNKLNEMTIIYNIDKNKDKIRLFGEDFVKDNKDNCYILIDGQKNELCGLYKLNDIQKNKNTLEIKLIETKTITDMSSMFQECNSLFSIPDISNWNTINVTRMSFMFDNCSSLTSLPDISNWNTTNVTTMSFMFNNCSSLTSLPDISNWNTTNVTDMSSMFKNCSSLTSLPDISKWIINDELDKNSMFDGCNENIIPKNFK